MVTYIVNHRTPQCCTVINLSNSIKKVISGVDIILLWRGEKERSIVEGTEKESVYDIEKSMNSIIK